jgi:PAS domain-containing protein
MRIARVSLSLLLVLENVSAHLQRMWDAIVGICFRVMKEPRRLQEALHERETRLQRLVTNSFDAIVVMNDERRLLVANPPALALFGVSEKNIDKFTIDAFLPYSRVPDFERHGPPFVRGRELQGECEIRRLDGSLRVAEFSFQTNFVPSRHLARFREFTHRRRTQVIQRQPVASAPDVWS